MNSVRPAAGYDGRNKNSDKESPEGTALTAPSGDSRRKLLFDLAVSDDLNSFFN